MTISRTTGLSSPQYQWVGSMNLAMLDMRRSQRLVRGLPSGQLACICFLMSSAISASFSARRFILLFMSVVIRPWYRTVPLSGAFASDTIQQASPLLDNTGVCPKRVCDFVCIQNCGEWSSRLAIESRNTRHLFIFLSE